MNHPSTIALTEKALELLKRGDLTATKDLYEQICALDLQDEHRVDRGLTGVWSIGC